MSSTSLIRSIFFTLGLFAFFPLASAAPSISFKPLPEAQYKLYEGGDYIVSVDLSDFAFTTKIDLYLKGPLDSSSSTEKLINSYEYSANGVHEFIWNGKLDGAYALPGKYQLTLKGGDICLYEANVLTHQFEVNPASLIKTTTAPETVSSKEDNFVIKADLETADVACIELRVDGKTVKTYKDLADGQQTLAWDLMIEGEALEPGEHKWELFTHGPACGGTEETKQLLASDTFKMTEAEEEFSALCAEFTDIDPSHPDCPAIGYVKSIGAMTGFPDGTFRPDSILLRDQVAKISLETFNLFDENADYCKGQPPFPDVPESQWSYQYICRGAQLGMITGYEGGEDKGKYVPDREVSRAEFLALILRNLTDKMPSLSTASYQDVPLGQWYTGFAAYSFNHSLFTGVNLFPAKETSRVEVARVLYKLYQLGKLS